MDSNNIKAMENKQVYAIRVCSNGSYYKVDLLK